MTHKYHFTRVSGNAKTGPIPVTTSSSSTCPPTCSFKGSGCYAEYGPLAMHWRQVSDGRRGCSFDELLDKVAALPRNQLWRHNQAGDLSPTTPGVIDVRMLLNLAVANKGRRGFTYTHFRPTAHNLEAVQMANRAGFTVNLSAETLEQADDYATLGGAPVVVVLPADATKALKTPGGRHVIVCPASIGNTDCLNCGICQQRDRVAIVGFPAHGSGSKKIQWILSAQPAQIGRNFGVQHEDRHEEHVVANTRSKAIHPRPQKRSRPGSDTPPGGTLRSALVAA